MNQPMHSTPYGTLPSASNPSNRKPVSLPRLLDMRARSEKVAMLTAYDATFAAVADAAGVDCILIGDSLGMVCQGRQTTVVVTLDAMRYHVDCVATGLRRTQGTTWVIGDLPFGSYQESKEQAMQSAGVLMQAGAHMVKIEGGGWTENSVRFLTERGVPVCAHLGLTPQTVHSLGGYRVQGRSEIEAKILIDHAVALTQAGARILVLEMVTADVSEKITNAVGLDCITIGIGSGDATAGQVLVLHDMLGIGLGRVPKFVRNFMSESDSVFMAIQRYVSAVKDGTFPNNKLHAW
jgi:3-methyl-2-oxobutanoate hydroxymethyltransferase